MSYEQTKADGVSTIRGWATWVDDNNWLFEVTDDPNGNQDPATLVLEPDTSDRTPEQPSVDWLDPARESCLIDGVRYTRAGVAGSAVEKLLAEWKRLAHLTRIGERVEGVPGTYERFVNMLEPAIEADRREVPSSNVEELLNQWGEHLPGRAPFTGLVAQLRAAIEADREGREGYEERWAVLTARHGGEIMAQTYSTHKAAHEANWKLYAHRGDVTRILVPARRPAPVEEEATE